MPLDDVARELVELNDRIAREKGQPATVTEQVEFLLGVDSGDPDFRRAFASALMSAEEESVKPHYVQAARSQRRAATWCGMVMGIQFAVAVLRAQGVIEDAAS